MLIRRVHGRNERRGFIGYVSRNMVSKVRIYGESESISTLALSLGSHSLLAKILSYSTRSA